MWNVHAVIRFARCRASLALGRADWLRPTTMADPTAHVGKLLGTFLERGGSTELGAARAIFGLVAGLKTPRLAILIAALPLSSRHSRWLSSAGRRRTKGLWRVCRSASSRRVTDGVDELPEDIRQALQELADLRPMS